MPPEKTSQADTDSEAPDHFHRWFCAVLILIGSFLLWRIIELLTEAIRTAQREQVINGLRGFVGVTFLALAGVVVMTLAIRGFVAFFGTAISATLRHRRLKKARRKAETAIDRKQDLVEERIRIAARMRATWLYERECCRLANAQARREFRDALQNSVTRSCEIAFGQIGLVIDEYESVVQEIGSASLDETEKAELLDKLTDQLNVAATAQKTRSAEHLMKEQIWKLRLETAERLSRDDPSSAVRYLRSVEAASTPGPGRRRAQALLRRLESEHSTQKATH